MSNRPQFVKVNGVASADMSILSGVPEELILGTVLALAYCNLIVENIERCITVNMFADDCVVLYSYEEEQKWDTIKWNSTKTEVIEVVTIEKQ